MKCGALILRELRGKKRPKLKIVRRVSRANIDRGWRESTEGYEVCDGEVKCDISLYTDYGVIDDEEHDCSIQVVYRCNKCGITDFPVLSHYSPEDLINLYLDTLP
jgi:hypothetical protein